MKGRGDSTGGDLQRPVLFTSTVSFGLREREREIVKGRVGLRKGMEAGECVGQMEYVHIVLKFTIATSEMIDVVCDENLLRKLVLGRSLQLSICFPCKVILLRIWLCLSI